MTMHVDTLKLADRLEAGGFTQGQARAMASALGDAAEVADIATQADLLAVEARLGKEIASVESRLRKEITSAEQRMTIKLGGMLVVMTGVIVAASHFFH